MSYPSYDLTFAQYQSRATLTAVYPPFRLENLEWARWVYPALELGDEAGEVLGKLKKIVRDHDGVITSEDRKALTKELGDVLWSLSQLATELDIDLQDVAEENLRKLESRKQRGVLKGSGDDR